MTTHQSSSGARTYTNAMLTVIAILLGVALLDRAAPEPVVARAHAQPGAMPAPDESTGLISAAEQRKIMIAELRQISTRLDKLDGAMSRVLNVKVVEMPPVRVQEKGDKP
jgi:hypothetical protein